MTKEFVLHPVAFTLGALSVQTDRSLHLLVLHKMLEKVFRSGHDLRKRFEVDLKAYAQLLEARILITGSLQSPVTCEFIHRRGLPISTSYYADMADSFVLGVLGRCNTPLVQVSEVRQRVEIFWLFSMLREEFYNQIEGMIRSELVISHDRMDDTDQKYLSLRGDALLVGEPSSNRQFLSSG